MTTPDPDMENQMECPRTVYNGFITPRTLTGAWHKFQNKDISQDLLLAYGYGDGGGGVTRDMLYMGQALRALPGLPAVQFSTAGAFFDRLHENVEKAQAPIPVWDGELYLELHRGTFTSQASNKKWNRFMETRLQLAEWLGSLMWKQDGRYPSETLDFVWKIVLRNQFHDILPGSGIHEVYEDSLREYNIAWDRLKNVMEDFQGAVSLRGGKPLGGGQLCAVCRVRAGPVSTTGERRLLPGKGRAASEESGRGKRLSGVGAGQCL